jgi:anthranilate phosphoribosyltransferase
MTTQIEQSSSIRAAIAKVTSKEDLTLDESENVMKEIMSGTGTPGQIGALLTALHVKGESIEEISAFAKIMRKFATGIHPKIKSPLLDTCGTGGDGFRTFNISTVTALVSAAAGCAVAKHGNRAMSSSCGSADLLESLGVKIDLEPRAVESCIEKVGIGFLFAPKFHPAMRFASPVRKEIGIPTVFNILGPLTNPANAPAQILGVKDQKLARVMARVLQNLGIQRAYVVHGKPGIDELSIIGPSLAIKVTPQEIIEEKVTPEDFGMARAKIDEITCHSKDQSVEIASNVLLNQATPAQKNVVLLNSAFAIAAAKNITPQEGMGEAKQALENLKAYEKLKEFIIQTGGACRLNPP